MTVNNNRGGVMRNGFKIFFWGMIAAFLTAAAINAEEITNDTLKTIFNRKSVRSYKNEAVTRDQLSLLVKAAMAAPTAVDKRPWEFIVITDRKVLEELSEVLPYAKMVTEAGSAVIILGDTEKQFGGTNSNFWVMDCSAATENFLLAAESMGLGAVWTAIYPDQLRVSKVREALKIPDRYIPLNLIPVGIPTGEDKPKDKYNAAQIHWEKW